MAHHLEIGLMYKEFYGLREYPFNMTARTRSSCF